MTDDQLNALAARLENRVGYDWRDGTQHRTGDPDAEEAAAAIRDLMAERDAAYRKGVEDAVRILTLGHQQPPQGNP